MMVDVTWMLGIELWFSRGTVQLLSAESSLTVSVFVFKLRYNSNATMNYTYS